MLGQPQVALAPAWGGRQARYDDRRRLCFMHIPKTSGVSVAFALRAALAPGTVIRGFDHVLFGGFARFDTVSPDERQHVYGCAAALPQVRTLISGHFAYSTLRAAYPDGQLITVLREPVSRLLSLWMFWRTQSDEALSPWGAWADYVSLARRPLQNFLDEKLIAAQTDNLAVRMLLWPHELIPADGFIDPAHDAFLLLQAQRRLEDFALVDIVDAPEMPSRIGSWLGRPFSCERHNETSTMPISVRAPLAPQLTARAFDLLEARSRLDLALWHGAFARTSDTAARSRLRQQSIMQNVARYGALMAAG